MDGLLNRVQNKVIAKRTGGLLNRVQNKAIAKRIGSLSPGSDLIKYSDLTDRIQEDSV